MAKSETIRARVEPEVKEGAEAVFKALGLNASEAITLFYRQVALRQGLPFEVRLPNGTTRAAIRDALEGGNLTEWADVEELKAAHELRTTRQFDRDLKRARRRGKKLDKLWPIVDLLLRGERLPSRCRRHRLQAHETAFGSATSSRIDS